MGTQTSDEACLRRHLAAKGGVVHCAPAPMPQPSRTRNGWAMAAPPKAKTNGQPSCASCHHPFDFFYRRVPMPTIRVELFEGRTPEQKRNLVAALTEGR